jgi:hypothetical protein
MRFESEMNYPRSKLRGIKSKMERSKLRGINPDEIKPEDLFLKASRLQYHAWIFNCPFA